MNLAVLELNQIGNYDCKIDNCSSGNGKCLNNG